MQVSSADEDFRDDAPVLPRAADSAKNPHSSRQASRLALVRSRQDKSLELRNASIRGGAIGGVVSAAIVACTVFLASDTFRLGVPRPPVSMGLGEQMAVRCSAEDSAFSVSIAQGLQFWTAGSIMGEMMQARDHFELGWRLQILQGKLYLQIIPDGYYYLRRSESLIQQIREAMIALYPQLNGSSAERPFKDESPPDVDLRFDVADRPVISSRLAFAPAKLLAPILTMCASADAMSTAVPDFSFDRWHDNGVGDETALTYMQLMERILGVTESMPYDSRIKKATFRGHLVHPDRNMMRQLFVANADVFDLGFGDSPDLALTAGSTPLLPMAQHPQYAVQVYLSGNGYSARLKYLLATGSPVVYLMSSDFGRQYEWFLPAMRPGIEYLPVYSPQALVDAVKYLLANPQVAKAMGAAGQEFVRQRLLTPSVQCWWRRFFHTLSPKLVHPVQRMHRSVAIPWSSSFDDTVQLWTRLMKAYKVPLPSGDNLTASHPAVLAAGFLPEDDYFP